MTENIIAIVLALVAGTLIGIFIMGMFCLPLINKLYNRIILLKSGLG